MEETLIQQRAAKRQALIEQGLEPYGRRFERSHKIAEIRTQFEAGTRVRIAGRLVTIRSHGKSAFADLKDEKAKIQIYVKQDAVGPQAYSLFETLDMGDIIGCEGELFKTRTGEESVHVSSLWLLSKSLRPLPEKWHGLKDIETRYRQRYVDLVVSDSVRDVFHKRSAIIRRIREELDGRGFLEVETPMMQAIPGGAIARPFVTHHNALDMDLYLRIAPELHLKRLLVGGFEKVYEINRNFRNEGLSRKHNPEFTMLEVYQAYADYNDMMRLCEELIVAAAESCESSLGKGNTAPPWKRIGYREAFGRFAGIDLEKEKDLRGLAARSGIEVLPTHTEYDLYNSLFEKLIESKLSEPTFIMDYPSFMCPLAKTKAGRSDIAERFELYIQGVEIANAYSELNDPVIQHQKFVEQLNAERRAGTHPPVVDEDYVRALEYGMPPAGGLGIGIDRLVMLLTGQESIRDVILFPQMRPEG